MSVPRGLSPDEQTAWALLAQSVTPIAGRRAAVTAQPTDPKSAPPSKPSVKMPAKRPSPPPMRAAPASTPAPPPAPPPAPRRAFGSQLDSHWNRKLKAGHVAPDYTLDLHGHTLDAAYSRIIRGIDQARAMDARLVLVIAGRERGADPADRSTKRGAIRAKLLDWLAASHHADAIAAVRRAHIRHGGEGALYLVLRRAQ